MLTWFTGRQAVKRFIAAHLLTEPGRFRLVPVTANGQPAFAVYQREPDGSIMRTPCWCSRSPRRGSRGLSASRTRACSARSACRRNTAPPRPGPRPRNTAATSWLRLVCISRPSPRRGPSELPRRPHECISPNSPAGRIQPRIQVNGIPRPRTREHGEHGHGHRAVRLLTSSAKSGIERVIAAGAPSPGRHGRLRTSLAPRNGGGARRNRLTRALW